jgi:uncharacterized protein YndB with AHSA1/START domain
MSPETEPRKVVITRELPFPQNRVWRALTQPELMAEWLMKTDFAPEPGHAFSFTSEVVTVDCEVIEIEPETRLTYSWTAFDLVSTVSWTLTATATGCNLKMEQVGFRPDQTRALAGARAGWANFIDQLEALLGRDGET